MTCDIHLTDTTHCRERVFTTHNSTPHERKIGTENMPAKGTRNSTLNIIVNIQPLRYKTWLPHVGVSTYFRDFQNFVGCMWVET